MTNVSDPNTINPWGELMTSTTPPAATPVPEPATLTTMAELVDRYDLERVRAWRAQFPLPERVEMAARLMHEAAG